MSNNNEENRIFAAKVRIQDIDENKESNQDMLTLKIIAFDKNEEPVNYDYFSVPKENVSFVNEDETFAALFKEVHEPEAYENVSFEIIEEIKGPDYDTYFE